jgi:hypothetical protein
VRRAQVWFLSIWHCRKSKRTVTEIRAEAARAGAGDSVHQKEAVGRFSGDCDGTYTNLCLCGSSLPRDLCVRRGVKSTWSRRSCVSLHCTKSSLPKVTQGTLNICLVLIHSILLENEAWDFAPNDTLQKFPQSCETQSPWIFSCPSPAPNSTFVAGSASDLQTFPLLWHFHCRDSIKESPSPCKSQSNYKSSLKLTPTAR